MNKYLFIGLDYQHLENRCIDSINNIYKLTNYIQTKYNITIEPEDIITDSKDKTKTSRQGIMMRLYKLGLETWCKDIKNVFIYYTGDSLNVLEYIASTNNIKEGIVPSDYAVEGNIITKEELLEIFRQYNPKTRIIFILDCCFTSQNILNLKYIMDVENDTFTINDNCIDRQRLLVLTYAIDKYSHRNDDNYFSVLNFNEKIHSYSDYISKLDHRNNSIFELLQDVYAIFKRKNINMKPVLSASYLPIYNDRILDFLESEIDMSSITSFEEYKRLSYTAQEYHYECYC